MKREDIVKYVETNNLLHAISRKIIRRVAEREKEIIGDYVDRYKNDELNERIFERYQNPYDAGDYITLFGDKWSEGDMEINGDHIVIIGYEETRDWGTEEYKFYVDFDLIENHNNEDYLNIRIDEIVKSKIENQYRAWKLKNEETKKEKERVTKLKEDKDYQLYQTLKKKFGEGYFVNMTK